MQNIVISNPSIVTPVWPTSALIKTRTTTQIRQGILQYRDHLCYYYYYNPALYSYISLFASYFVKITWPPSFLDFPTKKSSLKLIFLPLDPFMLQSRFIFWIKSPLFIHQSQSYDCRLLDHATWLYNFLIYGLDGE